MTNATGVVDVRLPADSITRLDEIVKVEGGTRAEVASRLLVKVLADLDTGALAQQEAYALLDLDEDIAGP
ncbi:MAG: hypothetical protein ACXVKA_11945 [Acidimicrobiia bacterium]